MSEFKFFKERADRWGDSMRVLWGSLEICPPTDHIGLPHHTAGELLSIGHLKVTSQLSTASRKIRLKYVGPLVVYKIIDPHNYLLMTLDGKLLRGLFEHERIKQAIIRTSKGNVTNLAHLKQEMSTGIMV